MAAPCFWAPSAISSSQFAYSVGPCFPVPFHLQQSAPLYAAAPTTAPVVAPAAATYPLPQYQQAQQLFQKDAQIITPEALESVKVALARDEMEHKAETKRKAIPRKAAGQKWEDPTLADWPENDYRLFCGDLGNEVNDDVLSRAFSQFPSFNMARVVRDKRTGKTKGYGFVSFTNPLDLTAALKERNGKYVGNRPIKLRKSKWKDRIDYEALAKLKNKTQKNWKVQKKSVLH
ncbi:RNA-binding protein 42-like [Benincasa hispida]|uniref:RNA-binding protein 42-like n=1 Tax=Benincasa hispida TaxID=102211 RepID=UPI0018FF2CD3|nr:RNA-binding protein 42-like [Benincasa hispida]